MVREDVVRAAGVDVESLAEERHRHRRALDVPARISRSPRTRPDLQPVLAGRLPEREVAGMELAWVRLAARARDQLLCRVAREPPVRRAAGDGEVDVPIDLVG